MAILLGSVAAVPTQPAPGVTFVTLGTAGGPVVQSSRSQPANLLVSPAGQFLVDVGDGAAEQLAKAGFQPGQIDGVFLSHLHLDHVGGLQGLIGLRWMLEARKPLLIYGPPGTRELVAGLIASLAPSGRIGFGFGNLPPSPEHAVQVVELADGADVTVGPLRVRAVRNSHYVAGPAGADPASAPLSLSYRFDVVGRSIGYTGDTGPSPNLAPFFAGVDLLVSEVIDLPGVIADSRKRNTQLTAEAAHELETHMAQHHLIPTEAAALARATNARELVVTHLGIVGPTAASEPGLLASLRAGYPGRIAVAHDLDRF
jgi:ribonuclease BN (tRNA processing enzyme)